MVRQLKDSVARELELLTRLRDEMKVQLHLAKSELRDEWNRLEKRVLEVEDELKRSTADAKGPAQKVGQATIDLIASLKAGYQRLKEQLGRP